MSNQVRAKKAPGKVGSQGGKGLRLFSGSDWMLGNLGFLPAATIRVVDRRQAECETTRRHPCRWAPRRSAETW